MDTGGGIDETGFVKNGEHSVAYQLTLFGNLLASFAGDEVFV
jgi:hypothetical protein